MKVVLLSDLHLTPLHEKTKDGFDVNKQFFIILEHLKTIDFAHIIVLGDICYKEAEFEIYDWFFDELEQLNKPFDIIPGNHDNAEMLLKILDQPTVDTYDKHIFYEKQLAGRKCYFLDTSEGILNNSQTEWLKGKFFDSYDDVFVFMHHPPCNASVPFMDSNYSLENRREVKRIFRAQEFNIDIFCGHYHVDKKLKLENTTINICPSPFFTLDDKVLQFKIKEQIPCFQILTITTNSHDLKTIYVDQHNTPSSI